MSERRKRVHPDAKVETHARVQTTDVRGDRVGPSCAQVLAVHVHQLDVVPPRHEPLGLLEALAEPLLFQLHLPP
eukprot:1884076-Alexandrium_andersonii.AAC.1